MKIAEQSVKKLEEALRGWMTALLGVGVMIAGEMISLPAVTNDRASWQWSKESSWRPVSPASP